MALPADMNALQHWALTRLGFSVHGALAITADQGLDSLEEIKLLSDIEASGLCKALTQMGRF